MFALRRRRVVIAAVAGGGALVLLASVGIFGLLRGPGEADHAAPPRSPEASASVTVAAPVQRPRPILATSHPERFAQAVAGALFTWDTRHPGGVSEWAQVLVDAADPDEASAVAADIRDYLPAPEYWTRLGDYGTRQSIEVESIVVPDTWSTALAQAAAGQLPDSASALTVVGVAERLGTWGEQDMRTSRHISFTMFVSCPVGGDCAILRLSRPDSPLE